MYKKITKNKFALSINIFVLFFIFLSMFIYVSKIRQNTKVNKSSAALLGDCNTDNNVDILDFQLLSNTFGILSSQTGYNSKCDFNTSNSVDILDFQMLSNNFGMVVSITTTPTRPPATVTRAPTQTISLTHALTPTPISQTGDVTIAAAGDIVCGTADAGLNFPCKDAETAAVVRSINPTAVFAIGDTQYESGTYYDYQNFYDKTWGTFKNITYPSTGNHEYGTTAAKGYFDYFNGVGVAVGRAGDKEKGWYSMNLGNWHIVVLNGECTKIGGCQAGSVQELWLKQDLAANTKACTMAVWHEPLFTSGHGWDTAPLYKDFWIDLYAANADLVLNGHAHHYERFAPSTPTGQIDNTRGIREFIVGTGGRDFTGFRTILTNSQIHQNTTFGVIKLILHSNSYDWKFMPISGSTFTDSGSTNCH